MRLTSLVLGAAALITSLVVANSALAESPTLKAIKDRGKLIAAIGLSVPPYGMTDADQKPMGLDVDLANMLAKDLGVELEIVSTTSANRIPYLLTNKVDITIATFGVTPERALSISFTNPYGANQAVVAGPAEIKAASMADLAGYSIAVVRGTVQDTDMTATALPTTTIRRYEDDATAAAAIASGQVDFIATAVGVAKVIAEQNPNRHLEPKFVFRVTPYSIGVRQGDPELLYWLNTALYYHNVNGELAALHEKWLGGKMPTLPSF